MRTNKDGGGGLALGCSIKLSPVLTRSGGDEVEAITVNIRIQKINSSCCTAYGPQNSDKVEKKDIFWEYLDEEAKLAEREGKGFLLQGDLNSWLGSDIIANDPRPQNNNGKRFSTFLQYNNLTVVNALKSCKGLITRSRTTKEGKVQKSIIDFFVVCNRLLPYVTDMIIDNQRNYTITNYRGSKRGRRAVDSDHVTLILNLNLNVLPQKPQRVEMLDFKNVEGQALFKRKTSETSEFTECFQNMLPLHEQCEKWFQKLKTHC